MTMCSRSVDASIMALWSAGLIAFWYVVVVAMAGELAFRCFPRQEHEKSFRLV